MPIAKVRGVNINYEVLGTDGNPIYDANGKFLKGPNYWKPEPRIQELLAALGGR